MSELLQLQGIQKRFGGVYALKGVDFELRPGEIHALLGENGAGKSTLIKIVSGVHQPDEGKLFFEGKEVSMDSPRDAHALGIYTVHQEFSLYPELSIAENIFLGHAPVKKTGPFTRIDWDTMKAGAEALLADLAVTDLDVSRKVSTLNVGNRQRVEIAKALSMDARLLIMDEPTAALTESDVEKLFRVTRMLRDRGVGIVFISHKLTEIFELADRVSVLRDGQYVGTRKVSDTRESELIQMMVGRAIDDLFPKQVAELGENVLEVENLVCEPYTKGVSFNVRAGEIVGLAGLVGSGRSETAQAIFGIRPIQSGSVRIQGKALHIKDPSEAVKHGLAYVPEDRGLQGLIRQMSIRANVSMAVLGDVANNGFISPAREQALAQDAIKRLAIRASGPEQIVGQLSGGNQQKVVVSKWLASKPKVLIIDEPTRGVDVGAKAEIHQLISRLAAEQGLAILMISSELPEILGMSDRVLVMRLGKIVEELDIKDATQERVGAAMMSQADFHEQEVA